MLRLHFSYLFSVHHLFTEEEMRMRTFFLSMMGCLLTCCCVQAQNTPRINKQSFAKIKRGMTEKEVIEILGVPPGDYSMGAYVLPLGDHRPIWDAPTADWTSNEGDIEIWYDEKKKVRRAQFNRVIVIFLNQNVAYGGNAPVPWDQFSSDCSPALSLISFAR